MPIAGSTLGAGFSPGSNSGLKVAFELPQTEGGASNALLYADCVAYNVRGGTQLKNRLGIGDTANLPQPRVTALSRGGAASFTVTAAQAPVPDDWRGKTIILREYFDAERYTSETIKVIDLKLERSEKVANALTGTIAWQSTTIESYHWPTTNTGGTAESVSDQKQFAGTVTGYDPQGLSPSETVVLIDWAGSLTNDTEAHNISAAKAKIVSLAGLVLPPMDSPHPYKLRDVSFDQYAINGGTARLIYGLTDTAEDVINADTALTVDANKLQTHGTTAAINNTAPTLHTASGQTIVRRTTTQRELNDSNTLYVSEEGQRDTKDDVQMDESQARIDKSGMESEGQNAAVFPYASPTPSDAAAPDVSLQAVATLVQELNRDEKKKVTYFQVNTAAERWVYERARALSDPSNIKNLTVLGAIFTTGSEPSAPGASGLVLKDKTLFTVASPNTSNLSGVLWTYAETTSADDEIFPRTRYDTDPSDLKSEAVTGAIVTTGAALGSPTAPTTPPSVQLVHWVDSPLTDASASNKSVRLYFWGKDTSAQQWTQEHSYTLTDTNNLASRAAVAALDGTPSSPGGSFVKRTQQIIPITHDHSGYVDEYGLLTTKEDREFPGTWFKVDVSDLESTGLQTSVFAATASATAAAPGSLQTVNTRTYSINELEKEVVYEFAKDTPAQTWTQQRTKTGTDTFSIGNEAQRAAIDGAPSAPSGNFVLRLTSTEPITHDHTGTLTIYGTRSPQEDLTIPGTLVYTDPLAIKSNSTKTETWFTGGSEPSDPTPPSGTQIVGKRYQDHNHFVTTRKTEMGVLDSEQEREYPATKRYIDRNGLESEQTKADHYTGSIPAPPSPDDDTKIISSSTAPVTPGGKMFVVWNFGTRNERDKLVLPHTFDVIDPSAIPTESHGERAEVDATTTSTPTWSGALATSSRTAQLTDGLAATHTLLVKSFGQVTPQQQQENELTVTHADPVQVYVSETATRITCDPTDTARTLAAGLLTANQSDSTFESVSVKKLTPSVALKILRNTGADKILSGSASTEKVREVAIPYNYDFAARRPYAAAYGDPLAWQYIFPDGAYDPPLVNPNGTLSGSVMPQPVYRTRGMFYYLRVRDFASTSLAGYLFPDNFGKVSSGAFGPFPAHYLMYAGIDFQFSYTVSGARRVATQYKIAYDNFMFCTDGRMFDGTVHAQNALTGFTVPQYYRPDVYIRNTCILDWPAAIDFAFLDS